MTAPLFSVIIPTYNRSAVLPQALQSVLNQTFQDYEVFVADDHSDDSHETRLVVENLKDPRFTYTLLPARVGPARARNTVLPLCRGEYISFLDSDDLWRPRKLEDHGAILSRDSMVGMVYSDEYTMGEDGKVSANSSWWGSSPALPSGNIAAQFLLRSFIGTMTVTVRKGALLEVGGFDERLPFNEDDDLWFRIMLKYPVVCSDYVAGIRRLHRSNMSEDRNRMVYYQIRSVEKYCDLYPDFMILHAAEARRRLRRIMGEHWRLMARRWRAPSLAVLTRYLVLQKRLGSMTRGVTSMDGRSPGGAEEGS